MIAKVKPVLCHDDCPVKKALDVLDGKWTLLILRDLLAGTRRFGELRQALGGINPKTLSDRLRALEAHGGLTRHVYAEVPPRVEYSLTKKGQSLRGVIEALAVWSGRWM